MQTHAAFKKLGVCVSQSQGGGCEETAFYLSGAAGVRVSCRAVVMREQQKMPDPSWASLMGGAGTMVSLRHLGRGSAGSSRSRKDSASGKPSFPPLPWDGQVILRTQAHPIAPPAAPLGRLCSGIFPVLKGIKGPRPDSLVPPILHGEERGQVFHSSALQP